MVGQWLGANAPERFNKIILANTACYYPDPTNWLNRIKAVKEGGIAAVADTVIAGLVDRGVPRTRTRNDRADERDAARLTGARLSRLLRGAQHARPARAAHEDQEPDACHRGTA